MNPLNMKLLKKLLNLWYLKNKKEMSWRNPNRTKHSRDLLAALPMRQHTYLRQTPVHGDRTTSELLPIASRHKTREYSGDQLQRVPTGTLLARSRLSRRPHSLALVLLRYQQGRQDHSWRDREHGFFTLWSNGT